MSRSAGERFATEIDGADSRDELRGGGGQSRARSPPQRDTGQRERDIEQRGRHAESELRTFLTFARQVSQAYGGDTATRGGNKQDTQRIGDRKIDRPKKKGYNDGAEQYRY